MHLVTIFTPKKLRFNECNYDFIFYLRLRRDILGVLVLNRNLSGFVVRPKYVVRVVEVLRSDSGRVAFLGVHHIQHFVL